MSQCTKGALESLQVLDLRVRLQAHVHAGMRLHLKHPPTAINFVSL